MTNLTVRLFIAYSSSHQFTAAPKNLCIKFLI